MIRSFQSGFKQCAYGVCTSKAEFVADAQVVPILLRHAEGLSHHLPSLLEELRAQGRRGEAWVPKNLWSLAGIA